MRERASEYCGETMKSIGIPQLLSPGSVLPRTCPAAADEPSARGDSPDISRLSRVVETEARFASLERPSMFDLEPLLLTRFFMAPEPLTCPIPLQARQHS